MAHVGLISCVSKKQPGSAPARELYSSPLFLKSREFVERTCDSWFVLSAKYGLVEPESIIDPYEETLNAKSRAERIEWTNEVWTSLRQRLNANDRVTVLAGSRYREFLIPLINVNGHHVDVPMRGLGIGSQLQWLNFRLSQLRHTEDIGRLYDLLRKLEFGIGGKRLLATCTGKMDWPKRGVYFFYEPREHRTINAESRIVRVGTHGVSRGSKSNLWNRLRTHRGNVDGSGNHRGSIFRLHVGAAISRRERRLSLSSWGVGQSADARTRLNEVELERMVSAHIGSMGVLWLAIEDDPGPASDRAYIERNVIGLLSARSGRKDEPSSDWLGRDSPSERIRNSGLWNLEFLGFEYAPEFLDVFEEYVMATIGSRRKPDRSIAPHNWHSKDQSKTSRNQLTLFDNGGCDDTG